MAARKGSRGARTGGATGDGGNHICFDRIVPDEYHPAQEETMRALVREMSEGASTDRLPTLHASAGVIPRARAAIVLAKRWELGRTIRCRFLDGSKTQRRKAADKASEWHDFANIKFKFVNSGAAEIRISFSADPGSWSAVGVDALVERYFPKYQPTMNFGWLRDNTNDTEWRRVVVHEFGHALGLIHEHQSPAAKLKWNRAEVYRVFSGPPNYWSKDDIDSNILEHYAPKGIKYTQFDDKSIMLYQFSGNLFTNGQATPNNTDLSAKDKSLVASVYPK